MPAAPTDPAGLRAVALRAIAAAAELPPERLRPDVDLLDLGLDSVDFWKILLEVEDHVGAEVPPGVLDRLVHLDGEVTVGHLADVLGGWDPGHSGVSR